jgi:hypothetical protein
MIRDVHLDFLPIQNPGPQIQGSKRHRIPDPDPQHYKNSTWVISMERE